MQYGVTMFMTDQTMPPVELARAVEERGLALAVRARAHAHPDEPARPRRRPATPSCATSTSARSTRSSRSRCAAAATERLVVGTGICLVAQRDPIVTAKAIATLDHLSGGRFVLGIGFGWNADEIADHGVAMPDRRDVAREHVLAMQALWRDDVAVVRRGVRADPAVVVVAQAGASRRAAGAHRRRARARSCSRTSPSTPTAGSRSAARASGPRCPTCTARAKRRAAIRRRLQIVPFGTVPDAGQARVLRVDRRRPRSCCGCPGGGADRVLPILDEYASLVGS